MARVAVERFVDGKTPLVFASRHRDEIEATTKAVAAALRVAPQTLAEIVVRMEGDPAAASACARVRMTLGELASLPRPKCYLTGSAYRGRTYSSKPPKK